MLGRGTEGHMPGQWWNWAADVLLDGLSAVPRMGGHLPKKLHWNKNCSRFLQCSHRSPCSRAGEGVARNRGGGQSRAAECGCRAKPLGSKAWPREQELESPNPPCHLSQTLRQCSGLKKPRGILYPLFFRKFPYNVFLKKVFIEFFLQYCFCSIFCFFLSMRHMGSELPDEGWDPHPRCWKGNPTTDCQGISLPMTFLLPVFKVGRAAGGSTQHLFLFKTLNTNHAQGKLPLTLNLRCESMLCDGWVRGREGTRPYIWSHFNNDATVSLGFGKSCRLSSHPLHHTILAFDLTARFHWPQLPESAPWASCSPAWLWVWLRPSTVSPRHGQPLCPNPRQGSGPWEGTPGPLDFLRKVNNIHFGWASKISPRTPSPFKKKWVASGMQVAIRWSCKGAMLSNPTESFS